MDEAFDALRAALGTELADTDDAGGARLLSLRDGCQVELEPAGSLCRVIVRGGVDLCTDPGGRPHVEPTPRGTTSRSSACSRSPPLGSGRSVWRRGVAASVAQ
ncbi:hypothetical protein [Aeromicrobium massiliense]|uniref:hypothetical protein n=1 Tax=Aeromicrobium massiliense TaxID=1464554 RepID=UPI000578A8C3|nr:hypothetical protein [Aeromicrobium massiliense]